MKCVWIVFSENMFWGVYKSAESAYGAVLDELSELALDANEGYDEESKAIYEYYEKQAGPLRDGHEYEPHPLREHLGQGRHGL